MTLSELLGNVWEPSQLHGLLSGGGPMPTGMDYEQQRAWIARQAQNAGVFSTGGGGGQAAQTNTAATTQNTGNAPQTAAEFKAAYNYPGAIYNNSGQMAIPLSSEQHGLIRLLSAQSQRRAPSAMTRTRR
ncbi:MAG: hypothetical protein H0U63_01520 [Burkholderiales bacterium]|nr:hypothetical protein [Burkholderiales bacterium]